MVGVKLPTLLKQPCSITCGIRNIHGQLDINSNHGKQKSPCASKHIDSNVPFSASKAFSEVKKEKKRGMWMTMLQSNAFSNK